MLEIIGLCLQGFRNTNKNISENSRCCWERFEPSYYRIYAISVFGFRSVICVDTKSKTVISWLNIICCPCNRMICTVFDQTNGTIKINNILSYICSPTRYRKCFNEWVYSALMLARHVSDLIGPSSEAFCISCIRRLWYVVIRVLLDTSSRYKVVGRW